MGIDKDLFYKFLHVPKNLKVVGDFLQEEKHKILVITKLYDESQSKEDPKTDIQEATPMGIEVSVEITEKNYDSNSLTLVKKDTFDSGKSEFWN